MARTMVSGTINLGSNPSSRVSVRSSRGLGRRPLTPVTRVQIPYGSLISAFLGAFFVCRLNTA